MSGNVTTYTNLITSEFQTAPNFMSMVANVCQPWADIVALSQSTPTLYDVDVAIGAQLDAIGLWVGLPRTIQTPLLVYFSWDTDNLGWDQGIWYGEGQPVNYAVSMDDGTYRIMLKAKIAANQWDGSTEQYLIDFQKVFEGSGITITFVDNQNDTIDVYFSAKPSALLIGLLQNGYLPLRPAGVLQTFHFPP